MRHLEAAAAAVLFAACVAADVYFSGRLALRTSTPAGSLNRTQLVGVSVFFGGGAAGLPAAAIVSWVVGAGMYVGETATRVPARRHVVLWVTASLVAAAVATLFV